MQILDWGKITPESTNLVTNVFTYIFNHDLSSPENIERTIRFIVGRLNYYDNHLPKDPTHSIKIDARGQQISDMDYDLIRKGIQSIYSKPDSLIIDIIK